MDDDVVPDKNALYNYEKVILNSNEKIGALMGLRYYEDTPFSFESINHDFENYKKISFSSGFTPIEKLHQEEIIRIYDMPFEGPIINCDIIDKIGYPNKEFFIIGDDTDYAIKINNHAPIYLTPSVKIDRMISPYSKQDFGWKEFYKIRNIVYINKIYGKNNKVKYIRTFNIYLKNILYAIAKSIQQKDTKLIKKISKITEAYISGIREDLGKKYTANNF